MKLPKIFIPNKSLDENIEKMLKTEKILKHREIEDVFSLLNLPEEIGGYLTNYKKNEDKKIPVYAWCNHFGSLFPPVLLKLEKQCISRGLLSLTIVWLYTLTIEWLYTL